MQSNALLMEDERLWGAGGLFRAHALRQHAPLPPTPPTPLQDRGEAGDNVGILVRGLKREDISRGQVLAKPGTVKTHKKFVAEVYVLKKEEGGRHTPFVVNYKPQFFFRTADVTGTVTTLKEVREVCRGRGVGARAEGEAPHSTFPSLTRHRNPTPPHPTPGRRDGDGR